MFNILREAKKKLRFYSERKVITGGEPIVFFSPDAYLSPHFSIQCIIAKVLQDAGEQVVVLRCNAYLPFCPMFPDPLISKISGKERMVCRACSSNSFRMTDQYGLRGMDLGPSFSSDIKSEVNQAIEGAPHNLFDFEYDGWKFGYLGSEHFTLNLKISDFEKFGREHRKVWLRYVNTSLLIYLGLKQVLKKLDCKTLVFYNESFPQLSARLAAMKLGIHVVELTHPPHKNVDRQRPVIMNTDVATYLMKPGELWSEHRNLALPPEIIKSIGEDLFTRFHAKGVFNYSPAKKKATIHCLTSLGLTGSKPLLVAFTSSLDELIANRAIRKVLNIPVYEGPQPFEDQTAWLTDLQEFVEGNGQFELVVRVHPREGPNRREGRTSEHLVKIMKMFRNSPRVKFVWPEQQISSYDLCEWASLVLSSWSSIGSECARLGIPVLFTTKGVSPMPDDTFAYWSPTKEGYFKQLVKLATTQTTSLESVKLAFRWHYLCYLSGTVDISDIIPNSDFSELPEFKTPHNYRDIISAVKDRKDIRHINLERLIKAQGSHSIETERDALLEQIKRFVIYLGSHGRTMVGEDANCSPLVTRLGNILGQSILDTLSNTSSRVSPVKKVLPVPLPTTVKLARDSSTK